jgi:DNA-binding protein YbaB
MTSPSGLGHLMRSPEEAMAGVNAWAQGLAEKAQRYQATQQRTEELRLTSSNSDGSVKVTVRADGSITRLQLAGSARTMPLEELSDQILTTMRRAQSQIADRVSDIMDEEIGEQDPQTRTLMVDNLRSRFPDPDADDEEDDDEPAESEPDSPQGNAPQANPPQGRPPRRKDTEETDDDEEDLPW